VRLLWYTILPVVLSVTWITACDDDPAGVETSTCLTEGPTAQIVDNHLPSGGDHAIYVSAEDVLSGEDKTYDIRGDNVGHTHSVTLTADNFTSLQVGDPVSVVSSNNGPVGFGHDHTVRLSCP
jgi:hypothetical protein